MSMFMKVLKSYSFFRNRSKFLIIAESLYSYIEQKIARLDLGVLVMYIFASTYT